MKIDLRCEPEHAQATFAAILDVRLQFSIAEEDVLANMHFLSRAYQGFPRAGFDLPHE